MKACIGASVVAALFVACSSADEHVEPDRAVLAPSSTASSIAVVSASASASVANAIPSAVVDLIVRDGEERLEGIYKVTSPSEKQRFEGTYVVLDDGTHVIMSYGERADRAALADKRVVVIGKAYKPDTRMRSMGGAHIDARVVVLAP